MTLSQRERADSRQSREPGEGLHALSLRAKRCRLSPRHCEEAAGRRGNPSGDRVGGVLARGKMDCVVALLLAMTIPPSLRSIPALRCSMVELGPIPTPLKPRATLL